MGRKGWTVFSALSACTLLLVVLIGCAQQKAAQHSAAKVPTAQQQQLLRGQQLAALSVRLKSTQARVAADNKALPILLAQSDIALKQSQAFKNQAGKTKAGKARKPLEDKAAQAQKLADGKAEQLVITRQDLYAQLATASDLQKQIKDLRAKQNPAEKVAAAKQLTGGKQEQSARSTRTAHQGKNSNM